MNRHVAFLLALLLCLNQPSLIKADSGRSCGKSNSGMIDTLTWRTYSADYPPEGLPLLEDASQGDSLSIWFKPLAPCTLKGIRFCMGTTSSMDLFIDVFQSRYDGHIADRDSTNARGWIGYNEDGQWVPGWVLGHSPLGEHIWGPFPYTLYNEGRGWIEIPTKFIGEPYIDANSFFISFWIAGTRKMHQWGMEDEGMIPYNSFRYYRTNADSPAQIEWGWFLMSPSLWVDAIVSYPANTPPVVSDMTVQNDTYGPGPFAIEAHIEDADVEDPDRAGVASVHLVWKVNGVTDSTTMYSLEEDNRYWGEIPTIAVGDTVHYHISAVDLAGARRSIFPSSFVRLTPSNPRADILLVRYSDGDGCPRAYTRLLDSLGYAYECWNMNEHRGIDESVYEYGRSTVIPIGVSHKWDRSAYGLFPTRAYTGNIWADYLDSGTSENPANILYFSTVYFDHYELHGSSQPGLIRTFSEGDFAYDYLGIDWLDLDDDSSRYYWGIENDPVTGDFFNDPLKVTFHPPGEFVETTTRKEASGLFTAQTPQEGRIVGARYDGGVFKTVILPWHLEGFRSTDTLLYYTHEFHQLIRNILDWFGTSDGQTGIEISANVLPEGHLLHQNYPNPFNPATAISYTLPVQSGEFRVKGGYGALNSALSTLHVTLKIFNVLGQEVATLVDEVQEPGNHIVTWDASDMSSGVYFYRITAGEFADTKRMVLLR